MRKQINLSPGQLVLIDERRFEFLNPVPSESGCPDAPDDLQFRNLRTHRVETLTELEFDELYLACKLTWPNKSDRPGDEPPEEPCEAGDLCGGCVKCADKRLRANRLHLLRAFDADPVPKSDAGLQAFLDREGPNAPYPADRLPRAATFRRLLRERGEPGDRRRKYVGDRRRGGPQKPRIHAVAEQLLWELAEPYWTNIRVSAKDVHAMLHTALAAKNREREEKGLAAIPIPGRTTVWRMLTRHTDFDHARLRFGARKAARLFTPIKGRLQAKRILDVAIMDHTVLDCFAVDDRDNVPVGRPWLTVLLDTCSRYPLAFILSFSPPSLETAMACIRRAVRPKADLHQRHPELREWVAYGVPRTILVDNGWEFTGTSFKDACEDAGISVEWAPVRTPQYKGAIERLFGTLNTKLIHKLKGAVPFRPQLLKEYGIDPQAEAVLLLSELEELIHHVVTEVYGREYHTGIKAIPEQVWRERQAIDGIDYAADLRALDRSMGKLGPKRVLNRQGVEFKELRFCSDAVFGLLNDLLPRASRRNRAEGSVPIKFKYWPEDLSKIAIWNGVRGNYVDVPCTQPLYARGLSEHRHDVTRRYAVQQGLKFSTQDERCAAQAELSRKIASFVNERSIGRRKQLQRLREPSSDGAAYNQAAPATPIEVTLVETISNRRNGDQVPSTSPRSGSQRRGPARPKKAAVTPPAPAAVSEPVADPFASYNRAEMIEAARKKVSR
ncbi:transposase family protein [Phenylobacterium sp.]|uniref:integrase catalytic domain-containing protein n=1 Tax=Phenylobacterium sp. TaxID=1871053 RepID=UPI002600C0CE|nr:transposase family protein [Phenylobacterium sp.]